MAWFVGQSLLFIALAFVLGLLVGWLVWGRRRVVQISLGGGSSTAAVPAPSSAPAIESESESESETEVEPVLIGASGTSSSTVDSASHSTVDTGSSTVDRFDVDSGRRRSADHEALGAEGEREPVADLEPEPTAPVEHEPVADLESEPVASGADVERLESEPVGVAGESGPVGVAGESESEPVGVGGELEPEPVALVTQREPEPALVGAAAAPSAGAGASTVAAAIEPDDDLKRIEGIGPKMSAALNTAGIRTFRQLSEADEPTLRAAIRAAGLRFAPSLVTWARQARLLADGDEDGFNVLTRQLIAGRETRRD